MKFGRIEIIKINNHLYLFDDAGESTGYLVIGENKALVIDTMNGVEDVKALCESLTDKPLMVVNTHGHCDHIFGNIYFDKAFIHEADMPIFEAHSKFDNFVAICNEKNLKMPKMEFINEGEVIDLGGLTLEVYSMPGHTPGGLMLLLKEDRILFTGDSINHHVWMQLPESLTISDWIKELERLEFLTKEADYILYGHANALDDIKLYSQVLAGAKEIVNGSEKDDAAYNWFGGVGKQHEVAENSVICYK